MRCLTFAPYAWRRFTPWGVMRCGRGLRTTHYIVRPRLTVYAAKICSFSLFANPVLINFKKAYQMGIPSLNSAILYSFGIYFCLQILRWRSGWQGHAQDDRVTLRMTGSRSGWHLNHVNITNIPDPVHKKGFFSGRHSHFSIHGQGNGRFSGQEKKKPPQ